MWQDEVNLRSDWLPKQAHLEYQVGLRRKSSLSGRIINPLLSKLNRSRWLDIGLVLFLHYICILLPSNMVAKTTFCLYLVKHLIVMLRFAVNVTTHFFNILLEV